MNEITKKNNRKSISKKVRFEVFKRDSFRCQYCGRSAPDVILEADHIKPVSEGGRNTLLNLITSCRDCNRGKGKRQLSDNTEVTKQKAALDDLNEKRQQMEMMIQWKNELEKLEQKQVEFIRGIFLKKLSWLNGYYDSKIADLLHRFDFGIVCEAAEIAARQYYNASQMFEKMGGICYNLRKKRDTDGS